MTNVIVKLNKVLKFSEEKLKFQSSKVSGTDSEIQYSELVVGAEVSTSSADGSIPASDGDYILDNGAEIKVLDGKISEIVKEATDKSVDEAVEIELETEKVLDEKTEVKDDEKSVDELKAEIKELKEEIEKLKTGFSSEIKDLKNSIPTKTELEKFKSELMEGLKTIPVEFSKTDTRVELENENKYTALASMFSKK